MDTIMEGLIPYDKYEYTPDKYDLCLGDGTPVEILTFDRRSNPTIEGFKHECPIVGLVFNTKHMYDSLWYFSQNGIVDSRNDLDDYMQDADTQRVRTSSDLWMKLR